MVYDRCSAAVSGMHGAFSESGGVYGGGANRGEGLDDSLLSMDCPADRVSAMFRHMRACDSNHPKGGSKDTRRCDWNYLGGMSTEDGRGVGGGRCNGVYRGQAGGEASGADWRKRSLSELSGMWGMADGPYVNRGTGVITGTASKLYNSVDNSIRPEAAEFIKRARWSDRKPRLDEPEKALSETSTRCLDA